MNRSCIPIPRHEPEALAAAARPSGGDPKTVSTTALQRLEHHDVALSSRYGMAHEFEAMVGLVDRVPADLRPCIDSILCDSQTDARYFVELRPCSKGDAEAIARDLSAAACEVHGGHDGIFLSGAAGEFFIKAERE